MNSSYKTNNKTLYKSNKIINKPNNIKPQPELKPARRSCGDEDLTFAWYSTVRQLMAIFKDDPNVTIGNTTYGSAFGDDFTVTITAASDDVACALTSVLKLVYDLGNQKGYVKVLSNGRRCIPQPTVSAEVLAHKLKTAFAGSSKVKDVKVGVNPFSNKECAVVIAEKSVIQYYDDDITDAYFNANLLTQNVLKEILSPQLLSSQTLLLTTELDRDVE